MGTIFKRHTIYKSKSLVHLGAILWFRVVRRNGLLLGRHRQNVSLSVMNQSRRWIAKLPWLQFSHSAGLILRLRTTCHSKTGGPGKTTSPRNPMMVELSRYLPQPIKNGNLHRTIFGSCLYSHI